MKFLVAVDGSVASRTAFYKGLGAMHKDEDFIYIVSTYEPMSPAVYGEPSFYGSYADVYEQIEKLNKQNEESHRKLVEVYVGIATKLGYQNKGLLLNGNTSDRLIEEATKEKVDLILVGRRGDVSRADRFFLGSTSLSLSRSAPCSVYIVKGDEGIAHDGDRVQAVVSMLEAKKIMVAVDGSDHSNKAFDTVVKFGNKDKDHIHIVMSYHQSKDPEKTAKLQKDAVACVTEYGHKATQFGFKHDTHVIEGTPHCDTRDMLCDFADKEAMDLVIVGTRGLGAFKRFFLGSVSSYLVQNSDCDVLVSK